MENDNWNRMHVVNLTQVTQLLLFLNYSSIRTGCCQKIALLSFSLCSQPQFRILIWNFTHLFTAMLYNSQPS